MNKSIASVAATSSLSVLNLNATVGLDDVISVFITKYEDQQIADRVSLQKAISVANQYLKDIVELVASVGQASAKLHEDHNSNAMFSVSVVLDKDCPITLDWDRGMVRATMHSEIKSTTVSGYNGKVTGSFHIELPIEADKIALYKSTMSNKTDLIDKLNQVQTNLRDVSRKERQVRGLLAQKKLTEAGMTDLLNDTSLLALVDESVLTD